jgi:hypothetical protein
VEIHPDSKKKRKVFKIRNWKRVFEVIITVREWRNWQTCLYLRQTGAGRQARKRTYGMYYVYVLSSMARKYIYVGLTDNVQRRIAEHNGNKERTTRAYTPFKTILIENTIPG